MPRSLLTTVFCITVLSGCAVGNTYDYRQALAGIPLSGTTAIEVSVVDERPYVLNGDKPATFVGLQRGGFGNPFNVNTKSGQPLAADMKMALESILDKQGFTIVGGESGTPDRTLEVTLREWKSDVAMRMRVIYDVLATVYDGAGTSLASNSIAGEEVMGGGMEGANSGNAARTFELVMTQLLRNSAIQTAMSEP